MDDEIWKLIPGFTKYEASTHGRIRNNRNGYVRKLILRFDGYLVVNIRKPGVKEKVELVHRMVALTFIPNPENKPTVNHKKHDTTNNNISNLEWATRSEQSNHSRKRKLTTEEISPKYTWGNRKIWKCDIPTGERIEMYETIRDASCALKSTGKGSSQIFTVAENHEISMSIPGCRQSILTAMGFKWEFDELRTFEKEEWRDVDPLDADGAEGYRISSIGRLSDTRGVVKSPYGPGYSEHALNGTSFKAHRLVALTFIPNVIGKNFVNHIDGDKNNPVVDNLEWVTRSENGKHAYKSGLYVPPSRASVLQYDLEGNFIKEFPSMKKVNMEFSLGTGLSRAIKLRSVTGGFIWIKRTGDIEQRVNMETYKHWAKRVKQYGMNGVFIKEWVSMQAAQKEIPRLQSDAATKQYVSGGYIWKLSNDNTPFKTRTMRDMWKKVKRYDTEMNFIEEYESVKAAKDKYPGVGIQWAIKNSKVSKGFRWKYS